ncbi:3-hydroxy-9,10-secoandrosta-1,3,5(10)-triene-9,17-dione monooxygenase oxygenase subunit [Cryptosporangium aurantiacum]|uniref:Flavin-dependent monooxygenase, oxygenase subunit HsaA n=1 Tax=Cryptosporangium aurantiacum TaxID=134849 RepID=A0A1M7K6I7_9ACTN|nr:3-hydroxy-9,10-secoandrosta-1,3,5(10)-triene-9,17-dione monooxygenase oxygenase subunit [Cryptosporangium aurantiacum]SHM60866.1 3-hydroxy-9,10-secoandrosta-1,3,5(10)-triene-9,17-dione monooxygenase [Cryptosporangium aurantiacum]
MEQSLESVGEKVLDAVRDLLPVLRERAAETEAARRIPAASIQALQETGVLRLLQPNRFGGHETHPVVFYRAVRLIASACGSTGWVTSVLGVHPWHVGLFAEEAQREVWAEDLDTRISSSYAPQGKATAVDGGFRFTGRWSFSSGSDHATWVLLGGLVIGPDGRPTDFRTFLLPRADYTVDDVWDTVGLRGTGSNDIVVDDVFVPEHRTLSFQHTAKVKCPGQELNDGPLFRMPYGTIHPFAITAPLIGMADGAYEAYAGHTKARVRASYLGEKAKDDPFAQVRVARAAGEIDAAWLQLERDLNEEYALAVQGTRIPLEMRLRARRDQVLGSARAIDATDSLYESAGGKAINAPSVIARFWRDAHAARVHAANDVERALVMYGRTELGLPVTDGMF